MDALPTPNPIIESAEADQAMLAWMSGWNACMAGDVGAAVQAGLLTEHPDALPSLRYRRTPKGLAWLNAYGVQRFPPSKMVISPKRFASVLATPTCTHIGPEGATLTQIVGWEGVHPDAVWAVWCGVEDLWVHTGCVPDDATRDAYVADGARRGFLKSYVAPCRPSTPEELAEFHQMLHRVTAVTQDG